MRSGPLRHKVLLQRPVTDPRDETGDDVGAFETYGEDWAEELAVASGTERQDGGVAKAVTEAFYGLRYRSDVRATHRMVLVAEDRTFDIRAAVPADTHRRRLRLRVQEVL